MGVNIIFPSSKEDDFVSKSLAFGQNIYSFALRLSFSRRKNELIMVMHSS